MQYYVQLKKGAGAGPFIGPRGGKWADPQHTIPWTEDHGHAEKQLTPEEEKAKAHRKQLLASTPTPKELPEGQDHYFLNPPGAIDVDISKLTPMRARPEGIENAAKYMELARQGKIPRRKPVSLKRHADGTYTVLDGNSTFAIASKYGWSKLRGVVEEG